VRTGRLSGRASGVPVVQPAPLRQLDDLAPLRMLDGTGLGTVLGGTEMRTWPRVGPQVLAQNPSNVPLAKRNQGIEALAVDGPDPPLDVGRAQTVARRVRTRQCMACELVEWTEKPQPFQGERGFWKGQRP
jgi:hypothetical protein